MITIYTIIGQMLGLVVGVWLIRLINKIADKLDARFGGREDEE